MQRWVERPEGHAKEDAAHLSMEKRSGGSGEGPSVVSSRCLTDGEAGEAARANGTVSLGLLDSERESLGGSKLWR